MKEDDKQESICAGSVSLGKVNDSACVIQQGPTAIEKLKNMTLYLDNLNTVQFNTLAEPALSRVRNKR